MIHVRKGSSWGRKKDRTEILFSIVSWHGLCHCHIFSFVCKYGMHWLLFLETLFQRQKNLQAWLLQESVGIFKILGSISEANCLEDSNKNSSNDDRKMGKLHTLRQVILNTIAHYSLFLSKCGELTIVNLTKYKTCNTHLRKTLGQHKHFPTSYYLKENKQLFLRPLLCFKY